MQSLDLKRAEEPGWRKRLMVANWTEKRLKRLKLLNKEGFLATVIAAKLGPAFTKAIVLRKLHLLEGTSTPPPGLVAVSKRLARVDGRGDV